MFFKSFMNKYSRKKQLFENSNQFLAALQYPCEQLWFDGESINFCEELNRF